MDIAARIKFLMVGSSDTELKSSDDIPRIGMVVDTNNAYSIGGFIPSIIEKPLYPYSRPEFLFYSEEETALSGDQSVRPVVCSKFCSMLPVNAGYAEVINAGKTDVNEDQAVARLILLTQQGSYPETAINLDNLESPSDSNIRERLLSSRDSKEMIDSSTIRAEAAFFAILDGHAGPSTAVMCRKCLHELVKSRLREVLETIIEFNRKEQIYKLHRSSSYSLSVSTNSSDITSEQLIIGALQSAFFEMDEQINEDKKEWRLPGGCAAIAALIFVGKIFIANAGDCRAVLVSQQGTRRLSNDFTPATERKRLQEMAYRQPELIGNHFSRLEYSRALCKKDLNTKVLYRDWFMDGWSSKTVRESDLKPPLISHFFNKARLLNTIGVSRGFGDHHLLTVNERLSIKPFLSPVPQVTVFDISSLESLSDSDFIILASDGLWDVLTEDDAARIVKAALVSSDPSDTSRYSVAAQELAIAARGELISGRWVMNSGSHASTDDITVFVIPLIHCINTSANMDVEEDDEPLSLGDE